jgi:ribonucleoside-triphosphate reductase
VEQIQDVVEQVLLASPFKKTTKAFILYRDQHTRNREMTKKARVDQMDSYLNRLDRKVRENSNMGFSLQGLNHYVSSEDSKIYWPNKIYAPEVRQAHNSPALHIHDLGLISGYCVGQDLQDLLRCGFRGVPAKVESKPAKHFG